MVITYQWEDIVTDEKIRKIIEKYSRCPYAAPVITRRGKPHTTVDFRGIPADEIAHRDHFYMSCALELASLAGELGEVPVGAVIVNGDKIVGFGINTRESFRHALGHAEISAIDRACRVMGGWRLPGCELFVNLEPCVMCAGGAVSARIPRIVYGASDKKAGALGGKFSICSLELNHKFSIRGGVLENESSALLSSFFEKKRSKGANGEL